MANRLAGATSPYLLQHADNPVDWWEWGPEAFAEARARNVPLLLSVGYAACHWCHVMAHESFEDDATAAYLNEHFVSIKVDREERPDIDAVYVQATVALTGHGGWPMTCFLDHDGRPFFAGTYFPDRPRHGQPSFGQLLEALHQAWTERGEEVAEASGRITAALARQADLAGGQPFDQPALDAAVTRLRADFDQTRGGFGGAPKFPPSMVLDFLLRHGGEDAVAITGQTLAAMAAGGIHDQLGGGFARYSVDAGWVVPHFEKMLYDNALLLPLYARWASRYGDPQAAAVARGAADFLIDELGTSQGAFASALDADTDGVEGAYYVWTPAQLVEALGEEDATWAAELLRVTAQGTFEHGASTLQLPHPPEDSQRWESVRARLLAARGRRTAPARDDKVVAAWNGLAISALVEAGLLLDEPAYVAAALRCGEFLAETHLVDGRLRRVSRDGRAGDAAGVLEDYGCVASAFLALAQVTAETTWLTCAKALLDVAHEQFAAGDGGYFDTAADAERLVVRPRDPSDNASPSGHSAMTHALLTYAALTGSGTHRDQAEAALRAVRRLADAAPRFAGASLAAAQTALRGPVEVAIIGPAGPERDALAAAAHRHAPDGAVVVIAAPGASRIPLLAGRDSLAGSPAAYVCRDLVCRRPVTEVGDLVRALQESAE